MQPSEEDWSIISSSSEVDESQADESHSTESSNEEEGNISMQNMERDERNSFSSVGTLRIPFLKSSMSSNNTNSFDKIEKQDDLVSTNTDNNKIQGAINFYENLSTGTERLNLSIKETSNQLYQNVRTRFGTNKEVCNGLNSDKEEGYAGEILHPREVITGFLTNEVSWKQKAEKVRYLFCNNFIAYLQRFIEENSEYLIYYVFGIVFAVLSGFVAYKVVPVRSPAFLRKPQPQVSILSRVAQEFSNFFWKSKASFGDLLYEQQTSSKFFGIYKAPTKQLRLVSLWNKVQEQCNKNYMSWYKFFKLNTTAFYKQSTDFANHQIDTWKNFRKSFDFNARLVYKSGLNLGVWAFDWRKI